jgi:hypothetical protein
MTHRRWKTSLFAIVLAVFAFVALGSWALSSPIGSAPDDDYHLASIWCAFGDREGLCAPGENEDERVIQERLIESHACYAFDNQKSGRCDLSDGTYVSTSRGNFIGSYPPVFYATMGIFASADVAVSTLVMRLLNAALFVGFSSVIISMLGRGNRGPAIWAGVVSLVPLGMFIIPSVNPSSWAVLSIANLWLALIGYFQTENKNYRIGFVVLAVLLAIMGSGARGDGAMYVALSAVLAATLAFERSRKWLIQALLPLGIVFIGAAFFLSAGQSVGMVAADGATPQLTFGNVLSNAFSNMLNIQLLWTGSLGAASLGWLDTPMFPIVSVTVVVLYASVSFWGLRAMDIRKALALIACIGALIVVPMYVYVREQIMVGVGVQPRYILPLVILFAGIAVYGFSKDHLEMTRAQVSVVLLGVTIANSVALHTNMRRYITGLDGSSNLNSSIEWWWDIPVSPMTVWFVGSAAFAMLMAGLFAFMFNRTRVIEPEATEDLSRI